MRFQYRYVPFGTKFVISSDVRKFDDHSSPEVLHCNELAADVGGCCWGYDGVEAAIFDHHFHRAEGQFPSAAAAVLHCAKRMESFKDVSEQPIWLVSHRDPDFDALSSLYLIRRLIDGTISKEDWSQYGIAPASWTVLHNAGKIDWYTPQNIPMDSQARWAILLAAQASRVDNCKKSRCPANQSVENVLKAAIVRGRNYALDGGVEFFDEFRSILSSDDGRCLDPYYDSVFSGSQIFRWELEMLDREMEYYRRDITRARKRVVELPQWKGSFAKMFEPLSNEPLLDSCFNTNTKHVDFPRSDYRAVDGVFLKDPESIMFRDLARNDLENSSMGQGFLFTAIVYSEGRTSAEFNQSDYFFSLDPERSGGLHLYPIWAKLQSAEVQSLSKGDGIGRFSSVNQDIESEADESDKLICRPGFELRAGQHATYFDDPWFDGSNYDCTIVATPSRGTWIGKSGQESSLEDDPVVSIVVRELLKSIEVCPVEMADLGVSPKQRQDSTLTSLANAPQPTFVGYRVVLAKLDDAMDLNSGQLSFQIAERLWRFLDTTHRSGVPRDFESRHLITSHDWIGVWNRRGVAIAYRAASQSKVDSIRENFLDVWNLVNAFDDVLKSCDDKSNTTSVLELSEKALLQVAKLRQALALPDQTIVRRFFEASRLDESMNIIQEVHQSLLGRAELERTRSIATAQEESSRGTHQSVQQLIVLQNKLEYVEVFLIAVYSAHLLEILGTGFEIEHRWTGIFALVFSILAAIVALFSLRPWAHGEKHEHSERHVPAFRKSIVILVFLLLLGVVLFLSFAKRIDKEKGGNSPHADAALPVASGSGI